MLEIKKWEEYKIEEKKKILNHWYSYYGRIIVSLEEWQTFLGLLDYNIEEVYKVAVMSYIHNIGPQVLVTAISYNKVDE